MNSYLELAEAIVLNAVAEYRKAIRHQPVAHYLRSSEYIMKEIEEFFLSDWFGTLYPNVEGEVIIKFLKEEYEDEVRNRKNSYAKRIDTIFKQ